MVRMVKYDEDAYVPEECCTMTNPQTSCGTSVPDDVCMPCEGGDLCDGECSGCVIQKIMNEYAKSAQEHDQLAEWLEELKQYRTIGTPEECREAVEKQTARKVTTNHSWTHYHFFCPVCNMEVNDMKYCPNCGQKLDWSDEE